METERLVIYIDVKSNKSDNALKSVNSSLTKINSNLQSQTAILKKSGESYSKLSTRIIKTVTSFKKFNNVLNKKSGLTSMNKNLGFSIAKFTAVIYGLKRITNAFAGFIKESNSYVENLNLFQVTFGELNKEALAFAETYSSALGLDPSIVMRDMGFFNQIATGFGLATDKAFAMSKTLTQISYDLSSFINIPIADAVTKVQSGIAGELEPLRRVGYALDEATLQQLAYSKGINTSIRAMTQAEKVQLRAVAIYEQSTNVLNDLAQTIESPANQLRVLNQQITLLKRSIGNIFIPMLNKVIPYLRAFIEVLTDSFNVMSKFFGFEIQGAREAAATNYLDSITASAEETEKALSKALFSFDKFETLGGASTKTATETTSTIDIDIPEYDALVGLTGNIDDIKKKVEGFIPTLQTIGGLVAAITVSKLLGNLSLISLFLSGLALAFIGLYIEDEDFRKSIDDLGVSLKAAFEKAKPAILWVCEGIVWFIEKFVEATAWVLDFLEQNRGLAVVLGVLAAAIWVINIAMAANPLGLLIIGIGIVIGLFALLVNWIVKSWDKIAKFWKNLGTGIVKFFALVWDSFATGINEQIEKINGLLSGVNRLGKLIGQDWNIQIGYISKSEDYGLPQYATGGFPQSGNAFIANESGTSEWIGKNGNSSAVVNDTQMSDIMQQAVKQGVIQALVQSGNKNTDRELVINIDGQELARANTNNQLDAFSEVGIVLN